MKGTVLITGASQGIGKALALLLAQKGYDVLGVARSKDALASLSAAYPNRIRTVTADIATEEGRAKVTSAFTSNSSSVYALIHNAGVIEPIGPFTELSLAEWRYMQAANVEAPIFLTQSLLLFMHKESRVLHISSGAAHRPIKGWFPYCITKAALFMVYQCLKEELAPYGIAVGSVKPGIVDTAMQEVIRSKSSDLFPNVEYFQKLHEEGKLGTPHAVASFIEWVVFHTERSQYSAQEWDISDTSHHRYWAT